MARTNKEVERFECLSDLRFPEDDRGDQYHASFVGIIVTVRRFGGQCQQIRLFDGTANEYFAKQDNGDIRLTRHDDEIPPDHLLTITVYNEVWDRFVVGMAQRRRWQSFNSGHFNHMDKGLFVEATCRVKTYNNVIDPVISSKDFRCGLRLLDYPLSTSVYRQNPAMKRVLNWLPKEYLEMNRKNFENAIPRDVIDDILDPKPMAIPATTLPIHDPHYLHKTPTREFSSSNYSSYSGGDISIPHSNNTLPNIESSPVRISSVPETALPQGSPQPKRRKKDHSIQSHGQAQAEKLKCGIITTPSGEITRTINDLNDIEDFPDETFAVHAIITDFLPSAKSLITKSSQSANIHMNWLKINLQDKFIPGEPVGVNDCLLIIMNTNQEVMKFLGVEELEYAYVTSKEFEKRFQKVVNKAQKRVFYVKRRRVKVHNDRGYLAAWEVVGLTLADLEEDV